MEWKKETFGKLNVQEKIRIAQKYRNGESLEEYVDRFGVKLDSLKRDVRHFIYYQDLFQHDVLAQSTFPTYSEIEYNDYITLDEEDAIIISDLEIPDVDPEMLALAFAAGVKFNIKTLIIAGDFLATDQQGLNDWINVWKDTMEISYANALGMGVNTIKAFMKWFERVLLIEGNHDDRVARKTQGEIHLGMFIENTGARYSRYGYLYMNTHRGPVYICHPRNYSVHSLALGQRFYNVTTDPEGRKCHIVLGHTHQAQDGSSPDDLMEIHALGCMRKPSKTKYINQNPSTHHKWAQGFMMIRRGYFYPLSRKKTDWSELLGDLCPSFAKDRFEKESEGLESA